MNSKNPNPRHSYPTRFDTSIGHFIIGSVGLLALIATAFLWPALASGQSTALLIHNCFSL